MASPEQPRTESNNDGNDASNVLSIILGVVIPGCAIITVVLMFLIWFMSDCLDPARVTGDDSETPECPKYSGSTGREQDHAPPPYEAARSHSGSATDRWGDDRTVCDEGDDDHLSQRRGDSRLPNAPSPTSSSSTAGVNSGASTIGNTTVA